MQIFSLCTFKGFMETHCLKLAAAKDISITAARRLTSKHDGTLPREEEKSSESFSPL